MERRSKSLEAAWLALLLEHGGSRYLRPKPEDHRDPLPYDVQFLRACGIRPVDIRDSLLVLRD